MSADDTSAQQAAEWRETDQAFWDERVPIHVGSELYDLQGFRAGGDALLGFEVDEVGDVAGKSLLHLQCHIGTDTLSWARRGAVVTGLDFSAPALAAARALAEASGLDATFVESDVYSAAAALDGATYDIVYTGEGALCWLPDISAWADTVASLLAPGGFLYLNEIHPVACCLDDEDSTRWSADYFDGEPMIDEFPGSYADYSAPTVHNRTVERRHPLSEVISALAAAGLRLEFLHEQDFGKGQQFDVMETAVDTSGTSGSARATYRLPAGRPRVPIMYSLRAAKR